MVYNAKRITAALAAAVMFLACFCCLGLFARAETAVQGVVFDIEGVLSDSDKAEMDVLLADTAEKAGFNVGIIFSDDLDDMSAREYTELYFDTVFGKKADGVMLLINGDFSGGDSSDWLCGAGEHGEKYAMQSQEILSACYEGLNKSGFRGLTESYCEYLLKDAGIASENSGVSSGYRAVLSDLDDKLTTAEETELLALMRETANSIECNVGVVITDDLRGMSDERYIDNFIDTNLGFGSSAIGFLFNNDRTNMNYADMISAMGDASDIYDPHADQIYDMVYSGLGEDDYYSAILQFCESLKKYKNNANPDWVTAPISIEHNISDILISFFFPSTFGLVIAIAVAGSFAKSYKKKKPISASAYIDTNRTRFTRKNDIFVREFTTHHTISSSSSSSRGGHHSGGGGHHSSSHHSHSHHSGRRR